MTGLPGNHITGPGVIGSIAASSPRSFQKLLQEKWTMNIKNMATNLGLDFGELHEILEIFVEATASDLAKLESALSSRKVREVVEAAHSIKGAAGSLGFEDTQMLAKKIEMNARENILDGSLEDAGAIKKTLNVISEALQRIGSHEPR